MARISKFVIAEGSIKNFFSQSQNKIYSKDNLSGIFEQNRLVWNLPTTMTSEKFIDRLISKEILNKKEIEFEGYVGKKELYIVGEVPVLQLAVSLINKSFLSHYSAVYLHGLTNQIPKTIYISTELSQKNIVRGTLKQEAIDGAFDKPQRKSASKAIFNDYTLLVHNAMNSNRAGVTTLDGIPVTNIERTLIDITVRPNYAGGVHSVLSTFENALDKISVNKLIAILNNMDFIYPYHQAIGFYLEKAGYEGKKLNELKAMKMEYDFYLTYEMKEKEYSETWKLYFPKGM